MACRTGLNNGYLYVDIYIYICSRILELRTGDDLEHSGIYRASNASTGPKRSEMGESGTCVPSVWKSLKEILLPTNFCILSAIKL